MAAAHPLADAAELLGGPGGPAAQTATAGWAAGFIAAIAMYFQIRGARAADRRLVLAGLAPSLLVAARMATGLALALITTVAALPALPALTARTGTGDDPGRVLAGTLMYAVIYLAIGALIGTLVTSSVNGTVLVLFVWILDVFFGPVLGAADRPVPRALPTHFVTLWMVDLPSRHSGRIGDLGWAHTWAAAAMVISWTVITTASRTARPRHRTRPGPAADQLSSASCSARSSAGSAAYSSPSCCPSSTSASNKARCSAQPRPTGPTPCQAPAPAES